MLRMETIASVKFIGKNITRSGVATVESYDESARAAHRSVIYAARSDQHSRHTDVESTTEDPVTSAKLDIDFAYQKSTGCGELRTVHRLSPSVNQVHKEGLAI